MKKFFAGVSLIAEEFVRLFSIFFQENITVDTPDFRKTWKRQLFIIWTAQFVAANGFSFALPFVPFYMQQNLGVSQSELPFYTALFGATAPFMMMIFSPVWGALADRYGRRKMLLRSYVGGLVSLGLMGAVYGPGMLLFLRLLQGVFCGTVSAAQTLVSTQTPDEHNGFALGSLHSAMFSGHMTGSFLGGIFAEYFGYRSAFVMTAVLMSISFFLVQRGVTEYFVPQKIPVSKVFGRMIPRGKLFWSVLPILLLMGFVMFCRQFDTSFVPLVVQAILGTIEGASGWTGALSALCGGAGVISGFALGILSDRFPPGRIAVCSALVAAAMMLAISFTATLTGLFIFRFLMVFAGSGLDPALQIWLSRRTPSEKRGVIFGYAASMRSFGHFLSPLVAGFFVSTCGLMSIYVAGPVFLLMIAWCLYLAVRKGY